MISCRANLSFILRWHIMDSGESTDLGRIGHGAKNAQIDPSHFSGRVYHFHP
jgi:hypothetical protein